MKNIAAFSAADRAQLAARGIAEQEALRQLTLLRTPPASTVLARPCTIGDGISRLAAAEHPRWLELAARAAAERRVSKFVPASGAASRMFQDVVAAAQSDSRPSVNERARALFEQLDRFPFAAELRDTAGITGPVTTAEDERVLLRALLAEFGGRPKALIPFHRTAEGAARNAFEEHIVEAVHYARADTGTVAVHFTISPDHRQGFLHALADTRRRMETLAQVTLEVTFSEQQPATDTLALAADNEPFRTDEGALLLRPAGHGALLHNLEQLGGDLVVVKNIDNIVPAARSTEVVHWKRVLIGYAVWLQEQVHAALAHLHSAAATAEDVAQASALAQRHFSGTSLSSNGADVSAHPSRESVIAALDRPLRVCGVVPNEGAPGGPPCWVREQDGRLTKQIVEPPQVDAGDAEQQRLFASATHFSPVDIVAMTRSWRGETFALERFVDQEAVLLARKSYQGRPLTALERPGLWNGAMAGWNTVFVEVPASTFAPVKTVFDLLRPEHQ